MEYIWLAVTPDQYELPLVVEKSASELARVLGITKNAVMLSANEYKKNIFRGTSRGYRITRVIVPKGE